LVGLGLLGLISRVDGTTLVRLQFSDLAEQASAIGRVRCLRVESYWKAGEIWTRTEFAVREGNKGSLPRILIVEMPGGVIGHLHSRVEEAPAFAPAEDAYLFLWTAPDGTYRILGWSQGTFRVHKNTVTGVEGVTQDSAAAPIFDPVSRKFRHGGVRNLPLVAFQLKLKRAVEHRSTPEN
jgi:hypothetical protein